MKTAALNYDFKLKNESLESSGDTLVISGLASNFDLDRQQDQMARNAFDRGLKKYLTSNPVLLYSHRPGMPMGRVTKGEVRPEGLFVEAELPRPEPGTEAANIWRLVKAGVIRAFSVGGVFHRKVIGGINTIVDCDLREVSVASIGAVPGALFSVQAGKAFGDGPPINRVDLLDLRLLALEAKLEAERTWITSQRASLGLL